MGYWKSKVLPKIKKVFDKNGNKKAAAEACKSFDDSKEQINKEFEEKKTELQPQVVEIYAASSEEIKTFVKEPKEAGLKKHSVAVHKFIEELVAVEFPGSKTVSEASSKYGPALVPGPVLFVFEKVSTFIVPEEKVEAKTGEVEESSGKEKEIILAAEEDKKEEEKIEEVAAEAEKAAEPEPAASYTTEAAKVEEAEAPKP